MVWWIKKKQHLHALNLCGLMLWEAPLTWLLTWFAMNNAVLSSSSAASNTCRKAWTGSLASFFRSSSLQLSYLLCSFCKAAFWRAIFGLTGALFLRFLLHWWWERNPPLLGTPVQRTHRFCTMPRLRQRTLALHHSRIAHGILLRQSFLLSLHIHGLSHPPLDNRSDLLVVVTFLLAHFHLACTVDSWLTWSVLRTEAVASTWRSSCNRLL